MGDLAGQKVAYLGFTGPIESNSVTRIAATLNECSNQQYDEVHFAFSSAGGLVADGIYLYNHIRALPLNVIAYNTGSCSSIAVVVFLAADKRHCSANAMFMLHPTAFHGGQEGMSSERLETTLAAALADDVRTGNILSARARLPAEVLNRRKYREEWITPDQAHMWGLVDDLRDYTVPRGVKVIQI